MKKYLAHITLIPLVLLALTPPWAFNLDCNINSLVWLWVVFTSGFLAILFFNFNVRLSLKLFILWAFIGCFISKAPYLCFTMYWSLIAGAYYYLLCRQLRDFTPVKKSIQALFFLIILLVITQLFGLDTLLNFNMKTPCVLGTIGNYMILGSFVCVLAPFLIQVSWLNWIPLILLAFISKSSGTILAVFLGLAVYMWSKSRRLRVAIAVTAVMVPLFFAYKTGDIKIFSTFGRMPVWERTIKVVNLRPLGFGASTYKLIFPLVSQDIPPSRGAAQAKWEYENTHGEGLAWRRAHNFICQLLFEYGYPGLIFFVSFFIGILLNIRKDPLKLAGMTILAVNSMTSFPDRMTQSVLIILMFLAFCEFKYKGECDGSR